MDFSLLKQLSDVSGVSGREERVREIVSRRVSEIKAAEPTVDRMGNLIARISGAGPRLALIAHMDEVGFLVSKIEPDGFVRVSPIGGVDQRVFWAQTAVVHGRKELRGVVGSVPPHLSAGDKDAKEKTVPIEECFIDLGMPSEEIGKLVQIGDPVSFATASWENETSFFGKALDDRIGLFVMLEAVSRAEKLDCDLYLIASTQEEYGLRGAGPAVFSIMPEIALVLEGTVASDTPGLKLPANLNPTCQGKGPEIRLTDGRMISDRALADFLQKLAEEQEIPRQMIVKKAGTTDATIVQVTGPGVQCCAVSVPVRYIHAPVSLAKKSDIGHTVSLVKAFLEQASRFDSSLKAAS